MKRILVLVGLISTLSVQSAKAQGFDWGEFAGQVIGGIGGFVLGKEVCGALFDGARPENRGFAQGVCAVGGAVTGALILGELMKSGNEEDMNSYLSTHRRVYVGPIGEPVGLNAGGYSGSFTPVRQYRHRQSRQICRVIRYEAYDMQGRAVYRSKIRDNRGRTRTVNYVEKFECRMKDNQWAVRPYAADNYVLYNPAVGGGPINPGYGPGPGQGGFNPQGRWGSRLR